MQAACRSRTDDSACQSLVGIRDADQVARLLQWGKRRAAVTATIAQCVTSPTTLSDAGGGPNYWLSTTIIIAVARARFSATSTPNPT